MYIFSVVATVSTAILLVLTGTLFWFSSKRRNQILSIDPVFLSAIFCALICIDFLILAYDVNAGIYSKLYYKSIDQIDQVGWISLFYIASVFAIFLALFLAIRPSLKPRMQDYTGQRIRLIAPSTIRIFVGVSLVASLSVLAPIILSTAKNGNLMVLAGIKQQIFGENPLAALMAITAVPAALLSVALTSRWVSFFLFVFYFAMFFLLGSRLQMIILLFAYAAQFQVFRRINPIFILLLLPGVLFASLYYMYLTRFSMRVASFTKFLELEDGAFSALFRSVEFSVAESTITATEIGSQIRGAWETPVAALFAIIPRDIIPWKPYGFSTELTSYVDLARWRLVKSEWTAGGIADLAATFGFVGAVLAAFILFYIIGRLCFARFRDPRLEVCGAALFLWFFLSFMRGDLYNLALKIWPTLIAIGMFWICKFISGQVRFKAGY